MNTAGQKTTEVVNELREWLSKDNARDFYYNEPLKEIDNALAMPKLPKSVLVDFNLIDTWYGHNYLYKALTGEATPDDRQAFAGIGYYIATLSDNFARAYPGNPPRVQFTKMAFWLAGCINVKWYTEARLLIDGINRELSAKFLNGGLSFARAAWFIVQVTGKAFGIGVNYAKFNVPRDPGVYKDALANWDTTDLKTVDQLVSALCDYHLSQAGFDEKKTYEFSFIEEYVYAYEILAWLSLREMHGIKNPESFRHPLMKLAINRLPEMPLPFTPMEPAIKVLDRLKEDFPNLV